MKRLSVLLALLGVGAMVLLLAAFDAASVWVAMLDVGWGGFAALLLWQGALFVILGAAWRCVLPRTGLAPLVWARMVRDSATTCLPFSPVGGYVAGARALTLHRVVWPVAAAATVVDVTAELVAQLLFSVFGVLVLLLVRPGSALLGPLGAGVAIAAGALALLWWQRGRIGRVLRRLGTRLLGEWFRAQGGLDRLEAALGALARPRRIAAASAFHLCGWFATGVGTWIALRLLGAPVDLLHVVALEALLDALVAAAFLVPGAAGVQEAGYIGLGALFGVPPDLALGVSLLRRAKDLAWGLPILALWSVREMRRLVRQ